MNKINRISTEHAIYIAGLFDGEGCITLSKSSRLKELTKTPTYVLRARVRMTDENTIRWLHSVIGGRFYSAKNPPGRVSKSPNSKPYFEWSVAGINAVEFLKQISPYLRLKKPQAELAFTFGKTISKVGGVVSHLSSEVVIERNRLRDAMVQLNHRGLSYTQ